MSFLPSKDQLLAIPEKWMCPFLRIEKGELPFTDVDNPQKWSNFTFHSIYPKTEKLVSQWDRRGGESILKEAKAAN